ncbi:adenylyl-sulfate kinase [Rhodopseudomonas sp. HC1]|uniref:adenylyl-sulfate kinase n=1 Tax=Rhodopseudomonas infernalis TaxID=2897386 RepID=UPI001EE96E70|nr:adenylyl-sulfate kinase [Rhodopseudomonas infernalis]MCG6205016.1 adenylyl-sulfate kinase [Rhodopseudomonas infernalis]
MSAKPCEGPVKDLLRFITCGSVDDGKSTMIGRMLHDSKLIREDTFRALADDSRRYGTNGGDVDLALMVDGLQAEREQGITLDVAYCFFSTPRRAFIVADTPGHEQYTRNMATGASTAQLAVVLIDARKGFLQQTKRHTYICSLLGLKHVVFAVNKIDLVGYSEDAFSRIFQEAHNFAAPLGFRSVHVIPISARDGDNIIARSARTPWYIGPALLPYLETVDVYSDALSKPFRFQVQWVNRPNSEFRGYAGTIASGRIAKGDAVVVPTSGQTSRIQDIISDRASQDAAEAGGAIVLTLEDDIDIARGHVLCSPSQQPEVTNRFAAHILWMDREPLISGHSVLCRIGTSLISASISIDCKIDISTRARSPGSSIGLNEVAFCNLVAAAPVAFDPYVDNPKMGAFVVIDRHSYRTVGAGMIAFNLDRRDERQASQPVVDKSVRAALKRQKPAALWFTGLSGAGKSTISRLVEARLHAAGHHTMLLDGDQMRGGLNRDLGFTADDRIENIRRAGEVAKLLLESGLIVLCAFISPYRAERAKVRELFQPDEFVEIFIDTPIETCMARDPKGLYGHARSGELTNFTGVDAPYEAPEAPEIHLRTAGSNPGELADQVMGVLASRGLVGRS